MKRSNWLSGLRVAFHQHPQPRRPHRKRPRAATRRATFESLEDRRLLALDYGDAPDTAPGTGPGNYNTLSTDNGPN